MAVIQKDRLPVLTSPCSSGHTFSFRPHASPGIGTTTRWSRITELIWFGICICLASSFVFHLKTYTHTVLSTASHRGAETSSNYTLYLSEGWETWARMLSVTLLPQCRSTGERWKDVVEQTQSQFHLQTPSSHSPLLPPLQLRARFQPLCHKEHSYLLEVYLKFGSSVKPSENKLR